MKKKQKLGPPNWSTIQYRLGDLQDYEKNPATISEEDAQDLAESLGSLGYVIPFVAAAPPNGKQGLPLVDGHQRKAVDLKLRNTSPDTLVDVRIPDRPLTEEEKQEAVIRLRKNVGEFDKGRLGRFFDRDDLIRWGFADEELGDISFENFNLDGPEGSGGGVGDQDPEEARKTLAERFLIPPFSVLDARRGYWQERKSSWISLGIQSELGRGDEKGQRMNTHTPHVTKNEDGSLNYGEPLRSFAPIHTPNTSARSDHPSYRQIKTRKMALETSDTVQRLKPSADQAEKNNKKRLLLPASSDLDFYPDKSKLEARLAQERDERLLLWKTSDLQFYNKKRALEKDLGREITTQEFYEYYQSEYAADQGTSIFDPVLTELAYRWWIPQAGGEKILDPFAGGSVRGVVASILGKSYTGIDLSKRQVAANKEQAKSICSKRDIQPRWIVGDSRKAATLAPGEYDFIFSCPPYSDLEVYSDNPADLSTLKYPEFIKAYREIIAACISMLKPNRFACFVVGDLRDKKGFYRNFPAETIRAFQDVGALLYVEAILVTAVGSLPIRVGRQFGGYRKLGKTHQNVLVFYKGDPKALPAEFGEMEISDPEEFNAE